MDVAISWNSSEWSLKQAILTILQLINVVYVETRTHFVIVTKMKIKCNINIQVEQITNLIFTKLQNAIHIN